MAGVYSVEGKLGTGKTKFAVWRAKLALLEGRRVASNVDLNLEHLVPGMRASYVRIPDKPTGRDLKAMGPGSTGKYDEERFGVLILDELGTWMNTRSFQDPGRAAVLDWLIHARKHRWEVYLIVQGAGMIDKQVRENLIEYDCRCMRMDKVSIPFIGKPLREIAMALFGRKAKRVGYLPRFHQVVARLGTDSSKVVAEKWYYRGDDLHKAYDTEQVFTADYPHAAHSVLLPWDWRPPLTFLQRVRALFRSEPRARPAPRPKLRAVQIASRLDRDEAWKLASRYVRSIEAS